VRQSPDPSSPVLATLAPGIVVQITGRTDDSAWVFVTYPLNQGSGNGWIDVASLEITGDLAGVPVLAVTRTATPSPSPTSSPSPTPSPTPTPTPTPTQPAQQGGALPDLTVTDIRVIDSGPGRGSLEVLIANVGQGTIANRPIEIVAYDQTGARVLDVTTGPLTIPPGKVQPIITGYQVRERQMLTVVVNPNQSIAEADAPPGFPDPNNSLTKAVSPP